ncbi:MAG: hypothetical protein IKA48_00845 [Fibrobacter sp.]|nr:hypothetical protein [Fibrobacter sp.]
MLESLYNAAYLAIFLSFARKAVNKLALDRSHYYVVVDVPGDPLVILAVAKDEVENAKPIPITRGMGKGGHIRYLNEPAILKMARKQNRRVLTIAEADYENPAVYRLRKDHPLRGHNRYVYAAASRIRNSLANPR